MLMPGFGIAAGQYERHATAAGRVVLESLIGPGLLVMGYMLGATGYGVWDFFGPILWSMLFALPLAIVAFTRPVTVMKGYSVQAAGNRWLDVRFLRHLLLFGVVLLVAALPLIGLIWDDLSRLIGVQYPLTATLKLEGIHLLTIVFGWVLLGWVASRIAHALMVKGSPHEIVKGAVWRGFDRCGDGLAGFTRHLGRKSREARQKREARKVAAASGAGGAASGLVSREPLLTEPAAYFDRMPERATGRATASEGMTLPERRERPTVELPVVASITTATAPASTASYSERTSAADGGDAPKGEMSLDILQRLREAAERASAAGR